MIGKGLHQFRPCAGERIYRLSEVADREKGRFSLSVYQLKDFDLQIGRILKLINQKKSKA